MSSLLTPLAAGEELIDAESFRRIHIGAGEQPGWRPPPIAGDPVARPEPPDFESCRTRREVEQLAVRWGRAHAAAAALFLARRGGIQAVSFDPVPTRIPGPIYWTTRPHALAAVLERIRPWRGAPAHDPLTSRILRSLGRQGVHEIVLLPIPVHERLVAFLYADAGREALSDAAVEALGTICDRVASVWERMIAQREQRGAR